jgi:hypothetical protein
MTIRSSATPETSEWPVVQHRAVALVTPHIVARAVGRLEDMLSALDLAGRIGLRAGGAIVGAADRAD